MPPPEQQASVQVDATGEQQLSAQPPPELFIVMGLLPGLLMMMSGGDPLQQERLHADATGAYMTGVATQQVSWHWRVGRAEYVYMAGAELG